MGDDSGPTGACCKVGRLAATYDLADVDGALARRHDDGESLRDLAEYLNRRTFDAALSTAGAAGAGDREALFVALTDDDVGSGRRAAVRTTLRNAGLDVEGVLDDFVSHQTVRTHLQECLDRDTGRSLSVDREGARSTIEWATTRADAVVMEKLEQLRAVGKLRTGPLSTTLSVRVTCEDCETTYRVRDLIARGRCDCARG
jgi:hypothetical protein